ncbi:uncharacterized protein [Montipora capricornis]|uniref:uncharacterized protein n=1 Tax=Montipora capricornis TaxID=246305 RepID=UPI0035F1BA14
MVDDWRLALDSKKITGSIAIDLSKAFDSICHNLLLAKLRAYGLNDDAIAFLQSYLTDRQQRVKNYLIVNSIKTQGMVLGSHTHVPKFFIGETKEELANSLKILGVTIDSKLSYSEHISNMLKKVYAKIGVLRRLKRLMTRNVSLSLYKALPASSFGILQPTTYWNK